MGSRAQGVQEGGQVPGVLGPAQGLEQQQKIAILELYIYILYRYRYIDILYIDTTLYYFIIIMLLM